MWPHLAWDLMIAWAFGHRGVQGRAEVWSGRWHQGDIGTDRLLAGRSLIWESGGALEKG